MLRPVSPFIEYYINYDYIAEALCENKTKPILVCNGKCYLGKQAKKFIDIEPVDQKEVPSLTIDFEKYPIATLSFFSYNISRNSFATKCIKGFNNLKPRGFISEVFHPPSF